jgi:hypothetical protein
MSISRSQTVKHWQSANVALEQQANRKEIVLMHGNRRLVHQRTHVNFGHEVVEFFARQT